MSYLDDILQYLPFFRGVNRRLLTHLHVNLLS